MGGSGTLKDMLACLGDLIHCRVVIEAQIANGQPLTWRYHPSSLYQSLQAAPDRLDVLLANLTRQTILEYCKARRPVEVWLIRPETRSEN